MAVDYFTREVHYFAREVRQFHALAQSRAISVAREEMKRGVICKETKWLHFPAQTRTRVIV